MSEYDNTNSGVLFVNQYKEQGDSRPDEYRLAGWKNTSKAGKRYISVKVEDSKPQEEGSDKAPF